MHISAKAHATTAAAGPRVLAAVAMAGAALVLGGCAASDWPVLYPDGPIALEERELLYSAVGLMLIVIVPVYLLAAWVLLRYRASANSPDYDPEWQSGRVDVVVWLGPALIVIAIGTIVWDYTHRLDPYTPLAGDDPVRIEAIAQDWKWLFIYPDENVASLNEIVIPDGRPVSFRITSDTVMNSLYIPGLAGQIFAMAGMQTRLNLRADRPDTYTGRNTQYSGSGFADQQFAVKVVSDDEYAAWLGVVRQSPDALDAAAYAKVAEPAEKVPPAYFSGVEAGLFDSVIEKYAGAHGGHGAAHSN